MARLAARQAGVVSRAQLVELGLTRGAIERRRAAGRLIALHRGVYAVGHGAVGARGCAVAALLAGGPGAVLSHRSAAAIWGLVQQPAIPEITLPGRARRSRPDLIVHAGSLGRTEIRTRHGLTVTSPARTVADLAAVAGRAHVERALAEALFHRLVTPAELAAVCRPGARGAAVLAELLGSGRAAPTRSALERRFLALLAGARLPRPLVD